MEVLKVTPGARRSFRETLRWSTRDRHAALDDAFVRMNHACHAQIDPILQASPLASVVSFAPASTRLDALERDMRRLSLTPLALPPFDVAEPDLAEAAGIAYVLEGSRLGATFIARRLEAAAKAGEGERSREFLTDSAAPKEFATLLDGLSTLDWTDQGLGRASDAAAATFDQFALAARLAGAQA